MGKLQALSKMVRQVFDLQKKLDVCNYPFALWMDTDLITFLFCFKVVSVSSLKKPNAVESPKAIPKFFAHRSSPPEPAAATVFHIKGPLHHKVSFWASLFGHPANLADSVRIFVFTKWAPQVVPQEAPGPHNP